MTQPIAQSVEKSNLLGAIFLIAGTTVGGGMLALPVETAHAGFLPALAMMLLCWGFMTVTGLFLVEASLWMEEGAHMMTMASRLLGVPGKILSAILYLFMAYASLVAYTAGGGVIMGNTVQLATETLLPRWENCLLFTLIFGGIVYFGTQVIGRINAILVAGMIAAYFGLVGVGVTKVHVDLLTRGSWTHSFMGMPLILTTFSYQMIVPSLTPYLKRDPVNLRKAVILGTTIPFVVYGIWQWVVLGTVPLEGPRGLADALIHGQAAVEPLRAYVGHRWLSLCAEFFAFFALVTSYLGIALGLFDFLADTLKMKRIGWSKVVLGLLIIIPSLVLAIIFPRAFLFSLEVSGGYGDAILNGVIPVSMIWVGRYIKQMEGPYRVFGGKPLLVIIVAIALLAFILQTLKLV